MNYVEKFDSGLLSGLGSFSGAGEAFSVDVQPRSQAPGLGGPDTIVVPDAHLLFSGDYKRSGLDLVLSKDGQEFVARDYFRGENRATLASPDGANLTGKTVAALAGQVDYAQAGGTIVPEKVIGQVTKLTGSATAIRNGVSDHPERRRQRPQERRRPGRIRFLAWHYLHRRHRVRSVVECEDGAERDDLQPGRV